MLQKKIVRSVAPLVLIMMLITMLPWTVSAVGTPVFQDLNITSVDNSVALVIFNEKVYPGTDKKTWIGLDNLNVSIVGGTATLASYTIQQLSSKNKAEIVLNITGKADGSEMLVVKPTGANKIYNGSGIAMAADAQISKPLNDRSAPQLSVGYPSLQNITGNSADLKVKSNEGATAYFVVSEQGNHSPAYMYVKMGYIWNGNGWGPVDNNDRKGSANLQANTEANIAISGLQPQSRYYVYVVLRDQADNFSEVNKLELNSGSIGSGQAAVTSTSYTVDDTASTISGVVYGTSVANFTANLTPVSGASVNVYQADGTTEASDIADGYKLKVTAADTTTTKTYTIVIGAVLSSAKEMTSFRIVNPSVEGVISGNNILAIVPRGTATNNLVAAFTLSANATAKVGDAIQQSGVTANNFGSLVNYVITAEDGSSNTYTVNVVDELTILKNAVLVGQHLFQLDNSNGLTRDNVISALGTGSNLWYKSSNGSWYDLLQINSINDLFDAGKAIDPGAIVMTKWYKTGDTVQIIP
ncbi:MAG: hypothetical protein ABFD18_17925 [Syntrophomonas sp.]